MICKIVHGKGFQGCLDYITGKYDKDKPFNAECRFFVETVKGNKLELDYVYKGTVKLGDVEKLTLTGNEKDGYKIG